MKILLWTTAPWVGTGYGRNADLFIQALRDTHEIVVLATYGLQGHVIEHDGIKVYPTNNDFSSQHEYAARVCQAEDIDLCIQHFDVWVLPPNAFQDFPCPIITYSPIDSIPAPSAHAASAAGALDNVAMSEFAKTQFGEADIPCSCVIPHAVDTHLFYPLPRDACRAQVGLPKDAFIIGSVAANKGARKNLFGQLRAFATFKEWHPNAIMYFHCAQGPDRLHRDAFDLTEAIRALDLEGSVYFTDPFAYAMGLSNADMRILYNCFDVLTECSFGEGAGLPILEAQACGVPVVGTDFSAIPEMIADDKHLRVPVAEHIAWHNLGVFHAVPSTSGIARAWDYVHGHPAKTELRDAVLEKASTHSFARWQYDWLTYITKLQLA
jgi:glycosyltransferase involved in cell wall biosynthesis